MRIHTHEQLLDLLDDIVAGSDRGDRTSADATEFWANLLTQEGHPLASRLPDESLVDWQARGLLGELKGSRVLDVGCGNGRNAQWFAEQGANVVGIDITGEVLDLVRGRMPAGVTLVQTDVLRGALPDGQFDVVYDSGCFHHIAPHRRATYLERVLPLVKPGGLYGITAFASEADSLTDDVDVIRNGDNGGGLSFTLAELHQIFAPLTRVDSRRMLAGDAVSFGYDFLNVALFRAPSGES